MVSFVILQLRLIIACSDEHHVESLTEASAILSRAFEDS